MRQKVIFILLLSVLLTGFFSHLNADTGIGLILGEPTGLTVKLDGPLVLGIAGSFKNDSLHIHCDFWLKDALIKKPVYWYAGVGIQFAAKYWDKEIDEGKMGLAVRGPLGLRYFSSKKLELFIELVPVLHLVPHNNFSWNGGIGFRYYVNL